MHIKNVNYTITINNINNKLRGRRGEERESQREKEGKVKAE